ncbi:hypothetical protein CCH79_00020669, partial [Gambusia affinis]
MTGMERLKISAGGQSEAWIGLYDPTDGTRTWYWSLPGVEFSETNWAKGEPSDNENQGIVNCVTVDKNLSWIETQCQSPNHFICYNAPLRAAAFHCLNVLHPTETNCWRKIIHLTAKMQWSLILLFLM